MKLQKLLLGGLSMGIVLSSCIDDKYDLADIDTTSRFKVNDLVLPLNLDPVLLSDIIKVEEGDQIKEYTIDGHTFYAVEESDSIYSDPIDVASFDAATNELNPTVATFSTSKAGVRGHRAGEETTLYFITGRVPQNLDYKATGIDGSVRALTAIYYEPVHFTMKLNITQELNSGIAMQFENVILHLPEGLELQNVEADGYNFSPEDYNPNTGLISIDKIILTGGAASINIISKSIDLRSSYPNAFSYDKEANEGTFTLNSEFSIEEGSRLVFSGTPEALATIPPEVEFNVSYDVSDLLATAMLGSIQYNLRGKQLTIDPVELDNLPSFLEDPETNLMLSNPQIYLNLNNPVGEYGLTYQSSLDIYAMRGDKVDASFPSPLIKVPATTGSHNILLAPKELDVTLIPDDYEPGLERLHYNNLGNILSNGGVADGMPDKLDIKLIDPEIPEQPIEHNPFRLGEDIPGMEGTYLFLAPLALKEGSTIVKTIDGWWSEDLADLTIDNLGISAVATSDLPTGVLINIYAIDRDGNKISEESTVKLTGLAQNEPIDLNLVGLMVDGQRHPINNLDGINIYVMTADNGSDEPLAPEQTITLKDLKAKVSGYYTKKL